MANDLSSRLLYILDILFFEELNLFYTTHRQTRVHSKK